MWTEVRNPEIRISTAVVFGCCTASLQHAGLRRTDTSNSARTANLHRRLIRVVLCEKKNPACAIGIPLVGAGFHPEAQLESLAPISQGPTKWPRLDSLPPIHKYWKRCHRFNCVVSTENFLFCAGAVLIVRFFFNKTLQLQRHSKADQQVCWFQITAVNSPTKQRSDHSHHSQTPSHHTCTLAINHSFMSSNTKKKNPTAWYPDALWELTDWWNNERATRWVDAGVSIRLFLPSACMNAMDLSSAGRPPLSSCCFWNGSCSCGEMRRGRKEKQTGSKTCSVEALLASSFHHTFTY